jgi:serine/threonine-protein kinase
VAPEALSGALVGEAADIYSLATIAYYLLTGEHPHGGRSPREVFQQLLTQPARPIRQTPTGARLSEAVEAVIMRSLSRDPAARHPTVQALAHDLARAAAAPAGESPAGPTPTAERRGGVLGALKSMFGKKPEA